ncbi:hypothetical protein BJX64DRAFT_158 [Aspergillus heterothallicus]
MTSHINSSSSTLLQCSVLSLLYVTVSYPPAIESYRNYGAHGLLHLATSDGHFTSSTTSGRGTCTLFEFEVETWNLLHKDFFLSLFISTAEVSCKLTYILDVGPTPILCSIETSILFLEQLSQGEPPGYLLRLLLNGMGRERGKRRPLTAYPANFSLHD